MPNADLPEAVGPAMRTAPIPNPLTATVLPMASSRNSLVATLIANPSRPVLTDEIVAMAAASLGQETERSVLARGIAADLVVSGPAETKAVEARLRDGAGRPAHRHRRAAAGDPAQAPVPGGYGFHHDRPGMHRRAGGLCRAEEGSLRDHRTRHARRDRLRAGFARARGAAARTCPSTWSTRSSRRASP